VEDNTSGWSENKHIPMFAENAADLEMLEAEDRDSSSMFKTDE